METLTTYELESLANKLLKSSKVRRSRKRRKPPSVEMIQAQTKTNIKNIRSYTKELKKHGIVENAAEHNFRNLAEKEGVKVTKQGYADFIILDEKNKILGFVEVKPKRTSKLRFHQKIFKQFCEQHGHKFIQWCPKDDFPSF